MPTPITSLDADTFALKTALDERRPLLLAMADQDIERQPKVDASVAAEAVIGKAPLIAQHRNAMIAQFGAPAGTLVDELLVVARATMQADVELSASEASGDLSAMEAEVRAEHTLLFTDALSLVNRKLLDGLRLEAARSTQGYRGLIHNTLVIVALLRDNWTAIGPHTPITAGDLARAEAKAGRMVTALGQRDQGSTRVPSAELRLRALSALVRHYDEIRRMISYLRWHEGDADDIAPSLYTRRPGRRTPDEPTDTPTPPAVVTPASPTNGLPAAPGVPLSPFVS